VLIVFVKGGSIESKNEKKLIVFSPP
jgi:hypothetical protein